MHPVTNAELDRSAAPSRGWVSTAFIVLAILGIIGLWVLAFFVQVLFAWGFRGEPKPLWFIAFTWSVYGAPLLVPVIAAVSLAWRSRTSR